MENVIQLTVSFPDIGKIDNDLTLIDLSKSITTKMQSIVTNFYEIGERLNFINDNCLYKQHGYNNLLDYTKCSFNLSKNQTYNFINVYKRFYNDPDFNRSTFGFSALVEMLPLSNEQIKNIAPGSTVKQIREIKKHDIKDKIDYKSEFEKIEEEYKKLKEEYKKEHSELMLTISENNKFRKSESKSLTYAQYKLLKLLLDEYACSFSMKYDEKFQKSKTLLKNFKQEKIVLIEEFCSIREFIESELG